jgi:serine/threonine-protein kinase
MNPADDPIRISTGAATGLSIEQSIRLNQSCDAFEAHWRTGLPPDIADSANALPTPVRPAGLRELILLDLFYRRKAGQKPDAADYSGRFPEIPLTWLMDALQVEAAATPAGAAAETAEFPQDIRLGTYGDYELLSVIARGGMGVVYRARQISLDRVVALKMIRSGEFASSAEARRFRQEVESVAALDHPNIVPIYEVGETAGRAYYTMRLLEGGSLSSAVARFSVSEGASRLEAQGRQVATAKLIATVARAVHHAHQRGILHRDLKPSNVLLNGQGEPHVVDFGLARRIGASSSLTAAGMVLGTPSYMAPEQARGGCDVTTEADVYGLGAMLFELLTGRPPFKGRDILETIAQVREQEVSRPNLLNPSIDGDLETICLKCLSKDATHRYGSAEALADDLDRWRKREPILARRIGRLERARKWMQRNPAVAALLGLAVLLLVVIAGGGIGLSLRLSAALDESEGNQHQAEQDQDAARRAEAEGEEKLFQSLVSEAKAWRFSHRIGQRYGSLEAVRKAAALGRKLKLPPSAFDELRNLAIAALVLPDLRPMAEYISDPVEANWNSSYRDIDPQFQLDALSNAQGAVSLRRVGNDREEAREITRLPGIKEEAGIWWSADSRYLSVLHFHGRLQVWRVNDGVPILALEEKTGCWAGCFSASGEQMITIDRSGRLRVYSLADGRVVQSFPILAEVGHAIACHPQRLEVAISSQRVVLLLDLTTGTEVGRLPMSSPPNNLAWHPDGEILGVAGRDTYSNLGRFPRPAQLAM